MGFKGGASAVRCMHSGHVCVACGRSADHVGHTQSGRACTQVKKCADAGADIVRITVQGKKEAEACMRIRERLFQDR